MFPDDKPRFVVQICVADAGETVAQVLQWFADNAPVVTVLGVVLVGPQGGNPEVLLGHDDRDFLQDEVARILWGDNDPDWMDDEIPAVVPLGRHDTFDIRWPRRA